MPDQQHTRESIAKTAHTLRTSGGLLRGRSQEEAERRVREAIRRTSDQD